MNDNSVCQATPGKSSGYANTKATEWNPEEGLLLAQYASKEICLGEPLALQGRLYQQCCESSHSLDGKS